MIADYENRQWARAIESFERSKAIYAMPTATPALRAFAYQSMKFWHGLFPRHLKMPAAEKV